MTTTAPPATHTATGNAWLTQLVLNPASRAVQHDLANAAALHQRVMSLVPDGLGDSPRSRAGVLFRLDTDGTGAPVLLVQTHLAPDTGRLPRAYAATRTRDMGPLLAALRPGLAVRYRLLGNTVRRCGRNSTEGRWKQAIPLRGEEANRWWTERAIGAGLTLRTVLSDAAEPLTAWHQPGGRATTRTKISGNQHKHGDRRVAVPHHATRFDGTATVRDPEALRRALLDGIGRSKSYGCGLLSLAPSIQNA